MEGFDFPQSIQENGSRDSSVGMVTRLRGGRSGIRIPVGERDVLVCKTSRPALGPPSLLSNGYRVFFLSGGKAVGS